MALPTPPTRQKSFTDFQTAQPSLPLPGSDIDTELDRLYDTLEQVIQHTAGLSTPAPQPSDPALLPFANTAWGAAVEARASEELAYQWAEYMAGPVDDGFYSAKYWAFESANRPGPPGPRGPRGFKGDKGDPGYFMGFELVGASEDLADRPANPGQTVAWAHVQPDGTSIVYAWDNNSLQWVNLGVIGPSPDAIGEPQTIYVRSHGDDDGTIGDSPERPFRSITAGVAQAQALRDAGNTLPILVDVGPGVYQEDGNIDVPDDVAVVTRMRTCNVEVTGAGVNGGTKNCFRLGSGSYVEGFTFLGLRVDDLANPTEGFAICFRPGALILRLPYVHKIVVYRSQPPSLVSKTTDRANGNPEIGNGGGVILADGAQVSQYSAFPQIVAWGATPSTPNGIGYCARNTGFINGVNAVTMWAHRHFMALSGGVVLLSGCSSQFGDWSLSADGSAEVVVPDEPQGTPVVDTTTADLIVAQTQNIIDDMWDALQLTAFTPGWTTGDTPGTDEYFTRKDAGILLRALEYALRGGKPQPMLDFTRGMFDYNARLVFSADKLDAFVFCFENVRDQINGFSGVPAATQDWITELIRALVDTIQNPVRRKAPSTVRAINHQWSRPLAGVTRSALPNRFGGNARASKIERSIWARNGGRVVYSGQDDDGNTVFVNGLRYDARLGRLTGPGFDRSLRAQAAKAAIAGSF